MRILSALAFIFLLRKGLFKRCRNSCRCFTPRACSFFVRFDSTLRRLIFAVSSCNSTVAISQLGVDVSMILFCKLSTWSWRVSRLFRRRSASSTADFPCFRCWPVKLLWVNLMLWNYPWGHLRGKGLVCALIWACHWSRRTSSSKAHSFNDASASLYFCSQAVSFRRSHAPSVYIPSSFAKLSWLSKW